MDIVAILNWVDGVTLTLHEQYDVEPFVELNKLVSSLPEKKSLRLNVFNSVDLSGVDTVGWTVKDKIEWVKNSPLPAGEVLKRLTA